MEGYTSAGASGQQHIGSVLRNLNGGYNVVSIGGAILSTPDNVTAPNTWNSLVVDLNFAAQTYTATLNGNPLSFTASGGGSPITAVPFRNTLGSTVSLAEYGFQAAFNTQAGVNANNAFFDNFTVIATPVPEPSSILFLGFAGLAAGARVWHRRRAAMTESAD
jgi:hypothetical protein